MLQCFVQLHDEADETANMPTCLPLHIFSRSRQQSAKIYELAKIIYYFSKTAFFGRNFLTNEERLRKIVTSELNMRRS